MITSTPLQTAYARYAPVAQAGMPASQSGWDADSLIAEDPALDGIGFGLAVCKGTVSDKAATLAQLSGGEFLGITMADATLPQTTTRDTDKYYDRDTMTVMTKGDIWVAAATNVSSGGAVYYNSTTGELGASGISNAVLINNARWMTSKPNTDQTDLTFSGFCVVRLGASAQ